jgi:thiamine kinase-like enzyme
MAAVGQLTQLVDEAEPRSLLHGDAHVGNLFVDARGVPCLVDWQTVFHGPWYIDVGYHIGCTTSPEERRRSETDLLRHYLDRLRGEGVDVPSWDEAWRQVRLGMIYGMFLWGITLKVAPAITTVMLERLGTAVADHDGFEGVVA